MGINIPDKYRIPTHPKSVVDAERKLRSEAPELYKRIAHLRDAKDFNSYEMAKFRLERSGLDFDKWIKTVTDFLNV